MVSTAADWQPPEDVLRAGEHATTVYRNAPLASAIDQRYRHPTRTQLPIGSGTQKLRNFIVSMFGVTQTYMPGRSHPMLDNQHLDMHQAGRAIDFMVYRDKAKGDAIANYLVEHADSLGIQYIVWSGNVFNCGGAVGHGRWKSYEGAIKHRDHPHVELTPDAAAGRLDWYQAHPEPTPQQTAQVTASAEAPIGDEGSGTALASWVVLALATAGIVLALAGGYAATRA